MNECVYVLNIPILGTKMKVQILVVSEMLYMDVIKFQNKISIPHMGWNYVKPTRKSKYLKI